MQSTGKHKGDVEVVTLQDNILKHYQDIVICVDVMFVQKVPFLYTISRYIKTITLLSGKARVKSEELLYGLQHVIKLYQLRGFNVVSIIGDLEFEPIRSDLLPIDLMTEAVDDHVDEAEKSIRTIKESVRCMLHSMPFKYIPKFMLIRLLGQAVKSWNQLPVHNGVSTQLSPMSIKVGRKMPSYESLKLTFGTYVQVHANDVSINDVSARTIGAIAL